MNLELSKRERTLLLNLEQGFQQVLIYKLGLYPSAVSFVLKNERVVTMQAQGQDLGPRFEVFPIFVSERMLSSAPTQIVDCPVNSGRCEISILQKSVWDLFSSQENKAQMIGKTCGSTTQYDGKFQDIPDDAINRATLHAGVEIRNQKGWSFQVATSTFPFALFVSNCDFSEPLDMEVYDRFDLTAVRN